MTPKDYSYICEAKRRGLSEVEAFMSLQYLQRREYMLQNEEKTKLVMLVDTVFELSPFQPPAKPPQQSLSLRA